MAGNLIKLTDVNFDETIQNSAVPVLVDFWAPWCAPCRMIEPIIGQIADEYAGKATVCRVNTDEHREAAIEYAINAIPTLILFNNGRLVKKWVGLTSKKDIVAELEGLA